MPAHRRARLQNGAVADRLHDGAVLALEGFAVGALGDPGPATNRLSRDDEASEMFQKAPELRVSGGVGDAAMEREILRDRVLAALERGADGIEALDDSADLRRRAAINSCSVGNRDPGGILPLVMSSVRRATSSPVNERGAGSGCVTERLGLLMPLTLCARRSSYDMTTASMSPPADQRVRSAAPRNQPAPGG